MENHEMKTIWDAHHQRYPLMQVSDFIKLSYQSIFGPAHLSANPTKEKLTNYLIEELRMFKYNESTPLVESIGRKYYRVSLNVIPLKLIPMDQFIDAFYQSMMHSPLDIEHQKNMMSKELDELIQWIEQNPSLYAKDYETTIFNYKESGYPSIHHSKEYQDSYHPHYRVIHQKYLSVLTKYI